MIDWKEAAYRCTMLLYEYGDMTDGVICSVCDKDFVETAKFLRNTHCPNCGAEIVEWETDDE